MIVENWKAELEKNLPDVEKYLTSVLQEDAKITVESADGIDRKDILKTMNKNDIYVFAKDDTHHNSVILVLDKEWFGLLSSIMMGVEEKENNEITRDLLKKFATELSVTMTKSLRRNGHRLALGELEILTLKQLEKKFEHGEYFHAKMNVSGLADEDVRTELLLGNPDVRLSSTGDETPESEKPEGEDKKEAAREASAPEAQQAAAGKQESGEKAESQKPESKPEDPTTQKVFTGMDTDAIEDEGGRMAVDHDQVISGRKVEFEGFDETGGREASNGHSRSMALLKDVEMEVSVQLGQIEMPLGKVLQLAKGSIIELDKLAGEPVDILVNGSKIAQGEVVVIDEHFGVRITNLITTRERIARLK